MMEAHPWAKLIAILIGEPSGKEDDDDDGSSSDGLRGVLIEILSSNPRRNALKAPMGHKGA